jgi:flagellin
MSRINTNVQSLLAQRILRQQNGSLTTSLERLSTGLRINRGGDDPAGLIASENLRAEKTSISAAIGNAERADQVINIAEGGLQEINALLLEVQGLVTSTANDAGLSEAEKEANQLQVDSILQTIDRIANATSFQGAKLLNGTFDFTITDQAGEVADFQINAAKLESGDTRTVQVVVTGSAQHAGLYLSAGGSSLNLSGSTDRLVLEVAGAKGSREFSFASGTTLSAMVDAINTFTSVTGVVATASGTGVVLKSDEFGSDQFVSVDVIEHGGINTSASTAGIYDLNATNENVALSAATATFISATNPVRDAGQDVTAIVNAIAATSKGSTLRVNTDYLDLSIDLTDSGAQTRATFDAFVVTGGGAKFNLGPDVNIDSQARLGLSNVAARHLGGEDIGFLDDLGSGKDFNLVTGDLESAQQVVTKAIDQVSSLRGRLGAFQKNVVGATIRSLGVALENTSAAESAIRDTDFASETASLTRSQILVNAATNVLAIANSQPQNVLGLLG